MNYFHVPAPLLSELRHLLLIAEDCGALTKETRDRATIALTALSGVNANPPSNSTDCRRAKA